MSNKFAANFAGTTRPLDTLATTAPEQRQALLADIELRYRSNTSFLMFRMASTTDSSETSRSAKVELARAGVRALVDLIAATGRFQPWGATRQLAIHKDVVDVAFSGVSSGRLHEPYRRWPFARAKRSQECPCVCLCE
jgi:hypothetical protein